MKTKQIKEELIGMDPQQIAAKIVEMRRELLTLRLQMASAPAKDFPSRKRALRRSIACGLTLLQQKIRHQMAEQMMQHIKQMKEQEHGA